MRAYSIQPFQSTHPRGVRRCPRPSTLPNSSSFNPRTRVGCDWCLTWRSLCDCGFQSTHPRGVRPLPAGALLVATLVSIHAPAWGATSIELAFVSPFYLFQSTHPRGVRRHGLQALLLKILFQSTHPRGVRLALAWPWELYSVCFNPRTRVGCDQVCSIIGDAKTLFQSTHPRGVRPHTGSAPPRPWRRFNPRTRVGCDGMSLVKSLGSMGFNPRTRVGCDITGSCTVSDMLCFNPRTRVGCDFLVVKFYIKTMMFQSTHPRGVRRSALTISGIN